MEINEALEQILDSLEEIKTSVDEIKDKQDRLDEAIANLNLQARDYDIEEYED